MVVRTTKHSETLEITFSMFQSALTRLESKILQSNTKYEDIYAIPRGGLIVGTCLSHRLKLPMTNCIKKNTLIVDDICDTGITLQKYSNNDKVVLVTKSAGLDNIQDVVYAYGIADHIWARFWWEVEDV